MAASEAPAVANGRGRLPMPARAAGLPALVVRSHADQRVQADIELARRSHMTHFKAVGLETILYQPDLLDADHFLPGIGDHEACGRRPNMSGAGMGKNTGGGIGGWRV